MRAGASCRGRSLFAPAIRLAEDGYQVTPPMHDGVAMVSPLWKDFPAIRAQYLIDGKPPESARRSRTRRSPSCCARSPTTAPTLLHRQERAGDRRCRDRQQGRAERHDARPTSPPTAPRSARRCAAPTAPTRSAAWARPRRARRRCWHPRHARTLRHEEAGQGFAGRLASDRRGDATRLCRPREISRRSAISSRCRSPG